MDLEHLTKTQTILLTLLVSFVTSIATGIVTVTLVNQAPTDVVRTINRVVEKTVETVVPGETKIIERIKESGPTESDLLALAVKKHASALLTVDLGGGFSRSAVAISSEGMILISSTGIEKGASYDLEWDVTTGTTTPLSAKAESIDETLGLALLRLENPSKAKLDLPYVPLSGTDAALGEKVFAMIQTPDAGASVRIGNVTALRTSNASTTPLVITSIPSESRIEGAAVFDLSGDLIGIYIGSFASYDTAVVTGDYLKSRYKSSLASTPAPVTGATETTAASINALTP